MDSHGKRNVFLVGDSIRIGYCERVRELLAEEADVRFPGENCRFAQYVLRNLPDWKAAADFEGDVDVVHWNAGLWDCLRLPVGDRYEPLTPLDVYGLFLDRVCRMMGGIFPGAAFVFATSTPIIEEPFGWYKAHRLNRDVRAYNEVAVGVARRHGHAIDDLYSVLDGAPASYYTDCTHPYSEEGTALLSRAVAEAIRARYQKR